MVASEYATNGLGGLSGALEDGKREGGGAVGVRAVHRCFVKTVFGDVPRKAVMTRAPAWRASLSAGEQFRRSRHLDRRLSMNERVGMQFVARRWRRRPTAPRSSYLCGSIGTLTVNDGDELQRHRERGDGRWEFGYRLSEPTLSLTHLR